MIYRLIDVFINTADLKRKFVGSLIAYNAMRYHQVCMHKMVFKSISSFIPLKP